MMLEVGVGKGRRWAWVSTGKRDQIKFITKVSDLLTNCVVMGKQQRLTLLTKPFHSLPGATQGDREVLRPLQSCLRNH